MTKAIEFEDVIMTYPDFKLGPLNFDLEPGRVLAYIGPNGAGKTTTMHCLAGLVRADQGTMKVFGRENNLHHRDWRFDIGYVGDVHAFYEEWTAEENLTFLKKFYPNWSDSLVDNLVERFKLPLKKKAKKLSGGNRVKLSLIFALAHSPKLLLLDEPISGLDPVVRKAFLDTLFDILEDGERAIFYSTHILSDISRLADELAFLVDGQVVLRQGKDELTENWRRISFQFEGNDVILNSVLNHTREGEDHQVISTNYKKTLQQLREIGSQNIHDTRLSIDEIAVEIMKEKMSF
jgi:ABC-2 type transport system ATP-binding protein